MSGFPGRVTDHPILGPTPLRPEVEFLFNGQPVRGHEGEPIAAALLAAGIRTLRRHEASDRPRGVFCGVGHCYECRVTVDGQPGVRACLAPVRASLEVTSEPVRGPVSPGAGGEQP